MYPRILLDQVLSGGGESTRYRIVQKDKTYLVIEVYIGKDAMNTEVWRVTPTLTNNEASILMQYLLTNKVSL